MTGSCSAREALIVEVIGEVANLLHKVDALAPTLGEAECAMRETNIQLLDTLAGFENRMIAITENAKRRTVQHLASRVDEATQRAINEQSRAMAEAARAAFGTELTPALQRLQFATHRLSEHTQRPWDAWLTHLATAATAATGAVLIYAVAFHSSRC